MPPLLVRVAVGATVAVLLGRVPAALALVPPVAVPLHAQRAVARAAAGAALLLAVLLVAGLLDVADAPALGVLLPLLVAHRELQLGAPATVLPQLPPLVIDGLILLVTGLVVVALAGVLGASQRRVRVLDGPLLPLPAEA